MYPVSYLIAQLFDCFPQHVCPETWQWFQTRASLGIARVKFWAIVLIAYHYIVLRDDDSAARVACPGNLAALKPPLLKPNSEPHHILPRTEQVVVSWSQ